MHFGLPILAFDCNFNRHTTQHAAIYFRDVDDIVEVTQHWDNDNGKRVGAAMQEIAAEHYVWEKIAGQYFDLIYQ
jgi:glycosyltransferase involved in cell wall biosynthesis